MKYISVTPTVLRYISKCIFALLAFSTPALGDTPPSIINFAAPLTKSSGMVSIPPASSTVNGYLTSPDWVTFNSKQPLLGFTPVNRAGDTMGGILNAGGFKFTNLGAPTANSSDAATSSYVENFVHNLNYSGDISGLYNSVSVDKLKGIPLSFPTVPTSGQVLTYSGGFWVSSTPAAAGVTDILTTAPLATTGGSTPTLSMPAANASVSGYLTTTDWNTFNNKEPAIAAGLATQYWTGLKTWATLNTAAVPESGNLYYTSARFNTDLATKTTDNLTQGTTNKYYSSALFNTDLATKTTDNLTEGSTNLYYTSARFNTAFAAKTTDNLTEGTTNKYYTDARARASLSATSPIFYNSTTGVISSQAANASQSGYLTSGDWSTFNNKEPALAAGTSLQYYRGDKTWATLNTAAVPESGNLYYTTARFNTDFYSHIPSTIEFGGTETLGSGDVTDNYIRGASTVSPNGTGATNSIALHSADTSTLSTGWVYVQSGKSTASSTGSVFLHTGDAIDASGNVVAQTGSVTGSTVAPSGTNSGTIALLTGDSSVNDPAYGTGNIILQTGTPTSLTAAKGSIILSGSSVDASSTNIQNVLDPVNPQDAATKNYVTTQIATREPTIAASTSLKYWRGDKTFQTLNTAAVPELTNLYYTDARARAALSATSPIFYNSTTGVVSSQAANTTQNGYLTSTDWNTFNNKVSGPATSTALAIARYSDTTGKVLKDSAVYVDDTGKMGVGTSGIIPYALTVNTGDLGLTASGTVALRMGTTGSSILSYLSASNQIAFGSGSASDFLTFNAGGTEMMRLKTNGNLGIQNNNPPYSLTVGAGDAGFLGSTVTLRFGPSGVGGFAYVSASNQFFLGSSQAADILIMKSGAAEALRLDTAQRSLFNGATGVTNSILAFKDGHLTSQQTTAPTAAANTGAGTGATAVLTNATDTAGYINITSGTSPFATGAQATITFNKTYSTVPVVVITAQNAAASTQAGVYVVASTTNFVVNFNTAPTASTSRVWHYHVIQTQ